MLFCQSLLKTTSALTLKSNLEKCHPGGLKFEVIGSKDTRLIKIALVCLILVFSFSARPSADRCLTLFALSQNETTPKIMQLALAEDVVVQEKLAETTETVAFQSLTNGWVRLKKQIDLFWYSLFSFHPESFTKQGDPRAPVFIFGQALSRLLGFNFEKTPSGDLILVAPGADRLEASIRTMNRRLRKMKKDVIAFVLVKSGFASPEEILRLSVRSQNPDEMFFPYDDANPMLTAHEVAFHLGSMVLPKALIRRAKVVTQRNLELADLILSNQDRLGPAALEIFNQIILDRTIELDFASGNSTAALAFFRNEYIASGHPLKTPHFLNLYFKMLADSVQQFSQANTYPTLSVAERMITMLDLEYTPGLMDRYPLTGSFRPIEENSKYGQKIKITDQQKLVVAELLQKFIDSHRTEDKKNFIGLIDSTAWAQDILSGLPDRIRELEAAGRDLNPTASPQASQFTLPE
jgi:hypothetical protein